MIVHHIEKTVYQQFDSLVRDAMIVVGVTSGENWDRPAWGIVIEGRQGAMLEPPLLIEDGADGDAGILAEALRWIADQIDVR